MHLADVSSKVSLVQYTFPNDIRHIIVIICIGVIPKSMLYIDLSV
jgi:hypothetical protein